VHIHRKILFGAAALALPASALATIAFGSDAYAGKPPPPPPLTATCTVAAAVVTFASPGLSTPGAESTTAKTTTTNVSGGNISCTGTNGGTGSGSIGTGGALSISTKSVKCTGAGAPSTNPACTAKGEYGYGSWGNFASNGVASLEKSLKKLPITIGATTLSTKLTSASETVGGQCTNGAHGGTEAGFTINYTVKGPKADKGQTAVVVACLGSVTGSGETNPNSFFQDASSGAGTVFTATVDTHVSSVTVS
jgi:hypothetical protein